MLSIAVLGPAGDTEIVPHPPLTRIGSRIHRPRIAPAIDSRPSVRVVIPPPATQGHHHDFEVEQNRPVADVPEVVFDPRLHLFNRVGLSAEPARLRPAADAG